MNRKMNDFEQMGLAQAVAKQKQNARDNLLINPVHGICHQCGHMYNTNRGECPYCSAVWEAVLSPEGYEEPVYPDKCNDTVVIGEVDPHGTKAGEPGAKLDSGKPMCSLLQDFSDALMAVAEVGTFGANKYSRGGWKTVPDGYNRYSDAMLRHYFKEYMEGDTDTDSGLLHQAHLAWNALARLQNYLEEKRNGKEGRD